jgi:hypothetical protein
MDSSASTAADPDVLSAIERRSITRVLHFTTNLGLVGVFATHQIKARSLLNKDQYLEHLFKANNPIRKDPLWAGYVSLSISRINTQHLEFSRQNHLQDDLWWCVIELTPEVLAHDGVLFVTANNIWPRSERAGGSAGLEALFSSRVAGRYSSYHDRYVDVPDAWTTCDQAEALYPSQIDSSYLRGVYVRSDHHAADVEAGLGATSHPDVPVLVAPEIFQKGWPDDS